MPANRRQFLTVSTLSVLATTLPKSLLAQQNPGIFSPGNLGAYQQGLINPEMFRNLVGETMTLFVDDGKYAYLRLVKVVDHTADKAAAAATRQARTCATTPAQGAAGSSAGTSSATTVSPDSVLDAINAKMVSFSLIFATSGAKFTQDTYIADSPRLGRFAIFVVPTGNGMASATFGQLGANAPAVVFPAVQRQSVTQ